MGNVSPRMNPQPSDRLHFDVQLAYARPVIALLSTLCLLELHPAREVQRPLIFLVAYLVLSVAILGIERALRRYNWRLPLLCDVIVVGIFLYISPEVMPAWFLLFFVAFAASYRLNLRFSLTLCFALLLLAVALDMHRAQPLNGTYVLLYSLPFLTASLLGAAGMAFLGDRNRQFATQQDFL